MTALVTKHLPLVAGAPDGIKKLRALILELAVRGKLVPHDQSEEPVGELIKQISAARDAFSAKGKARKDLPTEHQLEPGFDVPSGWQWVRLGDLLTKIGAGSTPLGGKQAYVASGIKFLRSQNVWNDGLRLDDVAFISEETHQKMSGTHVAAGDILFNITGASIGRCSLVPESFDTGNVSQHVTIIRPCIPDIRGYLHKALMSGLVQDTVMAVQVGVSREGLSIGKLAKFPIPLPPLAEQHRIVAKVDELMALCDRLEADQADAEVAHAQLVRALLDSLTQATDAADFRASWQRLSEHFHTLFTTEASIDALKETVLQLAVMGRLVQSDSVRWTWTTLGEVITGMDSGWSPACDESPSSSDDVWGVLRTTAVQTLRYVQSENKRLPNHLVPRPTAEVKDGDILFTRAGPMNRVGISCLVESTRPKLMLSDKIIRFRPKPEVQDGKFTVLCLNAGVTAKFLEDAKSGMAASQVNISQAKLKSAPVPVPNLAEQHQIVAKVDELISLCDQLKSRLAEVRQQHARLATVLVEQAVA